MGLLGATRVRFSVPLALNSAASKGRTALIGRPEGHAYYWPSDLPTYTETDKKWR